MTAQANDAGLALSPLTPRSALELVEGLDVQRRQVVRIGVRAWPTPRAQRGGSTVGLPVHPHAGDAPGSEGRTEAWRRNRSSGDRSSVATSNGKSCAIAAGDDFEAQR